MYSISELIELSLRLLEKNCSALCNNPTSLQCRLLVEELEERARNEFGSLPLQSEDHKQDDLPKTYYGTQNLKEAQEEACCYLQCNSARCHCKSQVPSDKSQERDQSTVLNTCRLVTPRRK